MVIKVDVRLEQKVAVPVTVDIRAVNGTALEGEGQYYICRLVPCISYGIEKHPSSQPFFQGKICGAAVAFHEYGLVQILILSDTPRPLTFMFSEAGTQVYPVAIVDDKGNEEFTPVLSNPQPDAVVFNPGSYIVQDIIHTLFAPYHNLDHTKVCLSSYPPPTHI